MLWLCCMKTPNFHYEISFPDFDSSDAVRKIIEGYLTKIEKIYNRVVSCHVAVRAPHMRSRRHIYHINIHLEIPGEDIIVNQEPEKNLAHSDIHIAIRDAFKALSRQLKRRIKTLQKRKASEASHQQATIDSFDGDRSIGFLIERRLI